MPLWRNHTFWNFHRSMSAGRKGSSCRKKQTGCTCEPALSLINNLQLFWPTHVLKTGAGDLQHECMRIVLSPEETVVEAHFIIQISSCIKSLIGYQVRWLMRHHWSSAKKSHWQKCCPNGFFTLFKILFQLQVVGGEYYAEAFPIRKKPCHTENSSSWMAIHDT